MQLFDHVFGCHIQSKIWFQIFMTGLHPWALETMEMVNVTTNWSMWPEPGQQNHKVQQAQDQASRTMKTSKYYPLPDKGFTAF